MMSFLKQNYQEIITAIIVISASLYLFRKVLSKISHKKDKQTASCNKCND